MNRLLPAEIVPYFARLPGSLRDGSTSIGLRSRIEGYVSSLSNVAGSFGGMSLNASYIAHTGISYVVGRDGEENLRADLTHNAVSQAYLTTDAIRAALDKLSVNRLGIVSPYPTWLEKLSIEYWSVSGFDVVGVESFGDQSSIYDVKSETVRNAVERLLKDSEPDAVLLSGTGLPTLRVLLETGSGDTPVVSSNSCSAWYASQLHGAEPSEGDSPVIAAINRWSRARFDTGNAQSHLRSEG